MTIKRLLARAAHLLLCVLLTQFAFSQNKTITGRVTDERGNPIQGATVVAKGTQAGTSTDPNGSFKITIASNVNTLVISSVGFGSHDVDITGKTDVPVSLTASKASLSEVVIIGYGTARKKDQTGALATISSKDFNQGPTTSPQQLVQGKVAGLEVTNSNGQPGAAVTIRIRGNSTIRSGNNPLYVIDGVPLDGRVAKPGFSTGIGITPASDPLYFFNSNDITNISILKDASATAIFGSRAANGVVLIETKKGQSGEPKLEINTAWGASNIMKKYKVADGNEYRQALKDAGLTAGDYGDNVDALKAILRTAFTQNYNVAMSGGNENGKYRVSLGYFDQDGIIKRSNLKRYSAEINGQYRFLPNKRLTVSFNVLASKVNERLVGVSNDAGASGNLLSSALSWNPTLALRRPNGTLWGKDLPTGSSNPSPLAILEMYNDQAAVSSIFAYVTGAYKFTDWLEYKLQYSVNHQSGERRAFLSDSLTFPDVVDKGAAGVAQTYLNTQVITQTLTFNKQLTEAFNLNALLGYEYQSFGWRGTTASATGFSTPPVVDYTDIMQNATSGNYFIGAFNDPKAYLQSYFVRATANFKDRYIVTGTFRADGSSKFGANNRYGYFPSFGAAWNINEEDFMKGNSTFSQLKLRGGWGITGNQEFPAGAAQTQFSYLQGTVAQSNVANPDLKWEKTNQTNIGVDFGFANGRITGSIDYFYKNTSNLLFNFQAIQPAPATKYWINLPGKIINDGVELTLSANVLQTERLTWNITGNATFLHNEVKNYTGPTVLTGSVSGQGVSGAFVQRLGNGQPVNAFYTRKWTGFDQNGFSTYQDGQDALFFVGNPNPKVLAGLSTSVSMAKWYFGLNLSGAFGHKIYNNTLNTVLNMGNLGKLNIARSLIGHGESPSNLNSPSSRYLENGNYVKFSNFTIRYVLGNVGNVIKNLNIALTGQNLFYITKFTGFSPEVNTDKSSEGVSSYGMEYVPYPTARTIQLGLSFSL